MTLLMHWSFIVTSYSLAKFLALCKGLGRNINDGIFSFSLKLLRKVIILGKFTLLYSWSNTSCNCCTLHVYFKSIMFGWQL